MEILLKGSKSGKTYSTLSPIWRGDNEELLDLEMSHTFCRENIRPNLPGFWRYLEALPIDNVSDILSLGEQISPIISLKFPSGFEAKIKCDFQFPTGSYKDRGAAILLSKIKSWGVSHIVQDSSGNAGVSVAAYAAQAGIDCQIFIPSDTSPGKIAQIAAYGAIITKVEGGRKNTAAKAFEEAKNSFYASHCYHPLFLHGTKTFAYEIWEQTSGQMPDTLVLPAGNGTLLLGAYIGFTELFQRNIITKIPKLIGVQSESCAPLKEIWFEPKTDLETYQVKPSLAEGIAIPNPIRAMQMVDAIRATGGCIVTVTEKEILQTWKFLCSKGFYVEPTSAATIAGVNNYANGLNHTENIFSVFTGSGLKSTEKILQILSKQEAE
jgi:threonine synthase